MKFLLVVLLSLVLVPVKSKVIVIIDDDFDHKTKEGVWMIDIYAPWCSHCRAMEPAWEQLSKELERHNISVAKVDGTSSKVLMMRFVVTAYPSIFMLREGKTYHYEGHRDVSSMVAFALEGYKTATPQPFYRTPNNAMGRAMGIVYSLPSAAKHLYRHLSKQRGMSDLAIIATFLLVPVFAGAVLICVLDAVYVRRARQHEHED